MKKRYYASGTRVDLTGVNRSNKQTKEVIVRGHFKKQGKKRVYVETHTRNTRGVRVEAKKPAARAPKRAVPQRRNTKVASSTNGWQTLKIAAAIFLVIYLFCYLVSGNTDEVKMAGNTSETVSTEQVSQDAKTEVKSTTTEDDAKAKEQTKVPEVDMREAILAKVPQACGQYYDQVASYDWPVDVAMAVMAAESSCIADRANMKDYHDWRPYTQCADYGSFGLFQLAICHNQKYPGDFNDPKFNIDVAYKIWKSRGGSFGGSSGWGAFTDGRYKQYLP